MTVRTHASPGGAIEVFLEPVLPAPRVLVVGDTPIAGAVRPLGAELGLDIVDVQDGLPEPAAGDLALVVAAHGRDELHTLRRGLESGRAVRRPRGQPQARRRRDRRAARRRGSRGAARADRRARRASTSAPAPRPRSRCRSSRRSSRCRGERRRCPAGHADSPQLPPTPTIAVDPICGMTVAAVAGTPSVEHDGETVYFCCEGCKAKFGAAHACHRCPVIRL